MCELGKTKRNLWTESTDKHKLFTRIVLRAVRDVNFFLFADMDMIWAFRERSGTKIVLANCNGTRDRWRWRDEERRTDIFWMMNVVIPCDCGCALKCDGETNGDATMSYGRRQRCSGHFWNIFFCSHFIAFASFRIYARFRCKNVASRCEFVSNRNFSVTNGIWMGW